MLSSKAIVLDTNQMIMAVIRLTLVLIIFALVGISDASEDSSQYVATVCNHKLRTIDSIAKFKEFMGHYKEYTLTSDKPKRGILNLDRRMRKCFALRDALIELEQIVDSRHEGVCSMRYINKLIEFKVKHILDTNEDENKDIDKIDIKSSYIASFFTIYVHQVVYHCKSQLAKKLETAQKNQDCSKILVRLMPELPDGETDDEDDVTKVASALLSDSRVENFIPILHLKHLNLPVAHIDVMVQRSTVEEIEALQGECKKIEPYYTASLSPIGALAQFGYVVESLPSNVDRESEDLLKCWLGAAHLCQGILRTHLKISDKLEIDPESDSKFVSVDLKGSPTETPTQIEEDSGLVAGDSFEEIVPDVVRLAKKRLTFSSKMKWKVSSLVKQFIERRIDIKASQEEALRGLLDSINSIDNDIDKKVSFGGKAIRNKSHNPTSIITDNADAIVRTASPFFSKEIGLLMSCVVGVVMTAVFVYLSIYMIAEVGKHRYQMSDGDPRSYWKAVRDRRLEEIRASLVGRKRNMMGMSVYKSQR